MRESEKKTMEMESNVKTIRVGDRILDLSRPAVMAIVNVTPDSFFAGSRKMEPGWGSLKACNRVFLCYFL